MANAKGYAAESADSELAPISFERREPRPDDVSIEIDTAGSATPISTLPRMIGVLLSSRWFRDTRLLAVSPPSAPT